jgi:prepilin-type N-terminal cleavage/methylation domain-containing protein
MHRWQRARRDEGFTLIEVIVAMALFAVLSTVVLASIDGASRLSRTNEHRVTAASLAARVLEAASAADPLTLPGPTSTDPNWAVDSANAGTYMKTVTTGGVPYVVRRWVAFVQQPGAPGRCGVNTPSRSVAQQVLVSVDWPGRPSGVAPVRTSSMRTVDLNAVAPTTGTLYVLVEDKAGVKQGGITVQLTRGTTTVATGTTDATTGCAVFPSLTPAGDYSVTLSSTSGHVDLQGLATPTRDYVAVSRGEVTEEYFTYSKPETPPAPPSGLLATAACLPASPRFLAAQTATITAAGTLTLTKPSDVVLGDLLLTHLVLSGTTGSLTPPAGWTSLDSQTSSQGKLRSLVFWRLATASEPASYGWGSTTAGIGSIAAFRGVDQTKPIDVALGSTSPSNSSSQDAPSVNATTATGALVALFSQQDAGSWSPPGGMTEHVDHTGAAVKAEVTSQSLSATGATGIRTAASTTNGRGAGHSVVVAGGPVPGVKLTWTESPSSYADGYRLSRFNGTVLEREQTIPGRTTTSANDGPLLAGVTYRFDLVATSGALVSSPVSTTFTAQTC